MIAGIYKITCKVNNKSYVGISTDIFNRIQTHFCYPNKKMKNDLNKYGIENFEFEILDIPNEKCKLYHSEAYYIRTFNCIKHGYNTEKGSNYMFYDKDKNVFYL